MALDPMKAQQIIQAINNVTEAALVTDGQPVLLTSPVIRAHLAQIVLRFIPTLPVVSQAEIPAEIRLQTLAVVELNNAG